MKIPKKIHIVWVGPKDCPREEILSWKEKNPKWDFYLWNEQNIVGFECQKLIDKCLQKKLYPSVADIVRYEVLYRYGGIAVDADSQCVRPIDKLIDIKEDCFACYQSEKRRPGLLSPQMGASKGNKLIRSIIDVLKEREDVRNPWMDTGNLLLTCMVYETKHPIMIYPSYNFIPMYFDESAYEDDDDVYAVQKWATTKGK